MVSMASLISLIVDGVCCLAIPVVFFLIIRKHGKVSIKSIVVGALVFIVFSQILEKNIHVYVLQINPVTKAWMKNIWVYATYGALMAGIFEEVGRFVGFKFILRNHHERKDGLAYGLGHGGIEALLVGVGMAVQYLIFSILINAGTFEQTVGAKVPQAVASTLKNQLLSTPWYDYGFGIWERAFAFIFHVALSLFVLSGIRNRKIGYLGLAILFHALFDFSAALYQGHLIPLIVVEGISGLFGIVGIWYILRTRRWKELTSNSNTAKIV